MADILKTEYEAVPSANGASSDAAARAVVVQLHDHKSPGGGPRATKNVKWLALQEEGEYADHQIKARVRYPEQINVDYFSVSGEGSIRDGLKLVVLEHNGWLDPDSDDETVLPPVDQKCVFDTALADALKAEEITYAVALKEARTDAARNGAEGAHNRALRQIHLDNQEKKAARKSPCCFWDSVSQEEVILMLRAVTEARSGALNFLIEKKPS